ncbi:MAG: hypothetical protein FJW88_10510 [Actinobacteria bacterium]|nr:hypothetical protein [Actinomycetota bacterium]
MGQPISVTARPGASPAVRIFECNRSLTGMAIERYSSVAEDEARGGRPPDVLAARILAAGATRVTVYGNVITVEASPDGWAELEPKAMHLVAHLFEYYGDDAGWSYEARGLEAPAPAVQ